MGYFLANKVHFSLVLLIFFCQFFVPAVSLAEEDKDTRRSGIPTIKISKSFFGSPKFTFDESKVKKKIFGFGGMSFTDEFTETMAQHPEALRKANKCHLYNGISMIGMLGLVISAAKGLVETLDDVGTLNSGQIPDTSLKASDIVLPVVSGIIVIIPGMISSIHFQDGVRMFNEMQLNKRLPPGESPISLERDFSVDLMLGINKSKLRQESGSEPDGRSGFTFGFLSRRKMGGASSIQSGLLITSKGNENNKLTYVEWPLHLRFDLKESGTRPFFYFGPSLSFLLSSSARMRSTGFDEDDPFLVDVGLTGGAGARLGSVPLSFSLMYSYGLINIWDDYEEFPAEKTSTLSVMTAYGF